ncbi:multicopper oxidase CueO [Sporichthya brevicatena]|uniref:Multicopper oxidase CueO n=1 Tax=Sporichthya brevicatena TaxID=171442 RepID=A0ABP3S2D4_9ACTN
MRDALSITRRRALALGGAAASLAVGGVAWRQMGGSDHLQPAAVEAPLRQPALLDSRNGRLQATLTAAVGTELAGHATRGFSYNGTSPGPTLRVRPGDEIALRLVNQLPDMTNLHTHGLRVSPTGPSDNPFLEIASGTAFDYRIRVPADHPVGTFWYHPHHHGVSADQIFGGLAGALLVVPPGKPVDIDVAEDLVLLIGDTTLSGDGTPVGPSHDDRVIGREGKLLLVNGQARPTIAAQAGTWQRWRLINTCTSRVLDIGLPDRAVVQVALDGSLLPSSVEQEWVRLSPGNRVDVLVPASAAGRFPVLARGVDRGSHGSAKASTGTTTLAILDVAGSGAQAPRPQVPTASAPGLPRPTRQRVITMTMGRGMSSDIAFGFDDKLYDPQRIDQEVTAGTTEEWLLNNAGPLAHPFHLHVWPFQVVATSDNQPPGPVLQDVVLVPPWSWVRVRIRFDGHQGKTVYHCHIVDHSDAGMMGTIQVG